MLKSIFVATRPLTLPASWAPILLATALFASEGNDINYLLVLNILLSATLIQVISNFANDLFDYLKGTDAKRQGPKRALASGLLNTKQMKFVLICTVISCIISAIPLVATGGLPIILIGLSGIFFAILYTASPWALAYLGFSELFVLTYFGPIATAGTYYLLSGNYSEAALHLGIIPGLLSTALLFVNNLRDYQSDLENKRKNLVITLGEIWGRRLYLFCMTAPAIFLTIGILRVLPISFAFFLLYLVLLPQAYKYLRSNMFKELFFVTVASLSYFCFVALLLN